jgi:uncharacterized protein (TIGR02145 family)
LISVRKLLLASLSLGMSAAADRIPSKQMPDGRLWTTVNLNRPAAKPSYCYGGSKANCRQYGRLYGWNAAQAACPAALGKGWRLPTDAEWRALAKHYGGVSSDSPDQGKAAYKALLTGGESGFNSVLGGGRSSSGEYARIDAHGFYWTATELGNQPAEEPGVVYYNFGKGGLAFHRQTGGEKDRAFSVRCIRDPQP